MREEIRQNMWQNETELICYGRNDVADKYRRQWSSTEGPEHHQPIPSQYKGGGPTVKGIQKAWFGGGGKKGSIFGFLL